MLPVYELGCITAARPEGGGSSGATGPGEDGELVL